MQLQVLMLLMLLLLLLLQCGLLFLQARRSIDRVETFLVIVVGIIGMIQLTFDAASSVAAEGSSVTSSRCSSIARLRSRRHFLELLQLKKGRRFVEDVVEKKKTAAAAAAEVQEIERRLIGCLQE